MKNPFPFNTSVKPALPAVAVEGATEEIAGSGFGDTALIAPPPPDTADSVPSGKTRRGRRALSESTCPLRSAQLSGL